MCRGRETLPRRDAQTTLERGGERERQTGEENWFTISSPLFDLIISRGCEDESRGPEFGKWDVVGKRVRRHVKDVQYLLQSYLSLSNSTSTTCRAPRWARSGAFTLRWSSFVHNVCSLESICRHYFNKPCQCGPASAVIIYCVCVLSFLSTMQVRLPTCCMIS